MREVYWNKMYRYRYQFYYLSMLHEKSVIINQWIKMIIAIGSASAIAAWSQWTNLAFIWGFIIALAQVLSVINDMLPYQKRIARFATAINNLEFLFIEMESNWYKVDKGEWDSEKTNTFIYSLERKWEKVMKSDLKDDIISENQKIKEKAEKEATTYLNNIFGEAKENGTVA